jgi:uncharacterized protein (TIGR02588 family)
MSERTGRTAAEWTTLVVSCSVLLLVAGLVSSQMWSTRTPPAPVATLMGEPHEVGAVHHVDVQVANRGDETAANVQVSAELIIEGEAITADQTIDFLAGDDQADLVFVFADDPGGGALSVTVTGFAVP